MNRTCKLSSGPTEFDGPAFSFLPSRPDHCGEIWDHCGYDVLQAMKTEHGGTLSTIRAKSAWDAWSRLSDLALSARANFEPRFYLPQCAGRESARD
ncbi:MAG: type secretion system protein [Edaphobacter sp.]|nr:type secretion system protein [Edaphobacter sp.]